MDCKPVHGGNVWNSFEASMVNQVAVGVCTALRAKSALNMREHGWYRGLEPRPIIVWAGFFDIVLIMMEEHRC
jgi:hypothetical protein